MFIITDHHVLGAALKVAETFEIDDVSFTCKSSFGENYIDAEVGCSLDVIIGDKPLTLKYRNDTRPVIYNEYPDDSFVLVNDGVLGKIYASAGNFDDDELAAIISELSVIGLSDAGKQDIFDLYQVMLNNQPDLRNSLGIECGGVGDYQYGVYEDGEDEMTFYGYSELAHDARVSKIRPLT